MMQYPERFSQLPEYAFPRLRRLLDGLEPGGTPIAMSIGEPTHAQPPFLNDVLARHAAGYSKYPPNEGHPDLRLAIHEWLDRRYGVSYDPESEIFPLNGTREGLFAACVALSPERKNGQDPVVLLPNPFYQCYAVAALTAGAEPVYVSATQDTGFLPDFSRVPDDILTRTTCLYICSPANPQGSVASEDYWSGLFQLAERYDFIVFADECYSEIYRDTPPPGAADVAHKTGLNPDRLVAFHSLSKRSSVPGLRSGFAASGLSNIARLRQLRSYVGSPLPLPAQHAAAACWRDEAHVSASRALYQEKFRIADRILGGRNAYTPPEAGFFLWIAVEDDEEATRRLWSEYGVKVLPGSYLARESDPRLGGGNPGAGFVRVALVATAQEVETGLSAIADYLDGARG